MEQLGKWHKIIPITWACPMFPLANFTVALVGTSIENFDIKFVTATSAPPYLWNKYSRDCIKFWRRGDQQSSLKHLDVNIHKICIILRVEEFQEMVHFIIIYWFNQSDVWILNILRVKLNWNLLRVNLNITIIHVIMIKSPHDSLNNRAVVGRRGPGFEVSFWRLAVSLSWWLIWFFAMTVIEPIHLSSKTWWE